MRNNTYYKNLIEQVIKLSESDDWDEAVKEWEILSCEEDEYCSSTCVCGKENIRYLFTIVNLYNSNRLFPIGSSCIKKFDREDLEEDINVYETMVKIYNAFKNKSDQLLFTSKLFPRQFIKYLYYADAFNIDTRDQDYNFMINMFNKKDKKSITENQRRKLNYLILKYVIPFIRRRLDIKEENKKRSRYRKWYKGYRIW